MEVDVVPGAISSQSNTSPTAPKILALRAFTNELPAREPPIQRFFSPLGTITTLIEKFYKFHLDIQRLKGK